MSARSAPAAFPGPRARLVPTGHRRRLGWPMLLLPSLVLSIALPGTALAALPSLSGLSNKRVADCRFAQREDAQPAEPCESTAPCEQPTCTTPLCHEQQLEALDEELAQVTSRLARIRQLESESLVRIESLERDTARERERRERSLVRSHRRLSELRQLAGDLRERREAQQKRLREPAETKLKGGAGGGSRVGRVEQGARRSARRAGLESALARSAVQLKDAEASLSLALSAHAELIANLASDGGVQRIHGFEAHLQQLRGERRALEAARDRLGWQSQLARVRWEIDRAQRDEAALAQLEHACQTLEDRLAKRPKRSAGPEALRFVLSGRSGPQRKVRATAGSGVAGPSDPQVREGLLARPLPSAIPEPVAPAGRPAGRGRLTATLSVPSGAWARVTRSGKGLETWLAPWEPDGTARAQAIVASALSLEAAPSTPELIAQLGAMDARYPVLLLRPLVLHERPQIRVAAVKALSRSANAEALPALVSRLRDRDAAVVGAARAGLEHLSAELREQRRWIGVLDPALKDPSEVERPRRAPEAPTLPER